MEMNAIRQVAIPWAGARGLATGLMLTELHQDVWSGSLELAMGIPTNIDTPPQVVYWLSFGHLFGYRVLEGADVLDFLHDEGDTDCQIQLITPSRFLTWFHQETQGSHLEEDIQHYRIASWDFCVDILAAQPPDVCIKKE
ncbi:hypothetical protein C7I36_06400 [Zobellella taiwanensis]|uniref:Uncharacterized protein n=1 Tax=Zobellella taiwanensis TaxID=347535 RepID=A0A2P7R4F1_9GAMM|nr:hypothetical protein [Zobellella taiwanensis]PSJ45087.1 hypothetical protein C7I36_06400 [Zobellella taiwanensis]